jgi:hypothetical protein
LIPLNSLDKLFRELCDLHPDIYRKWGDPLRACIGKKIVCWRLKATQMPKDWDKLLFHLGVLSSQPF